MSGYKNSDKLELLLSPHDMSDLIDTLDGIFASTCTTGYDNDGSTGFEIFSNGVILGGQAGERDIYVYDNDGVALFFIGNEDEILTKVGEAVKEAFQ